MKRSKLLKISSAGMLAALAIAGTACSSSNDAGTSPGQQVPSENSSVGTSGGTIGGSNSDTGSDMGSTGTGTATEQTTPGAIEPSAGASESTY